MSATTRAVGCTAHTFTRPRGGARCSSTVTWCSSSCSRRRYSRCCAASMPISGTMWAATQPAA
eukprot:scaffold80404_cov54-Phaeocystis_antarctica.AAC.1